MSDKQVKGEFKPFRVKYWTTTYIQLNPFMGVPVCPKCKTYDHLIERSYDEADRPVTVYEFFCTQCQVDFSRSKVND